MLMKYLSDRSADVGNIFLHLYCIGISFVCI